MPAIHMNHRLEKAICDLHALCEIADEMQGDSVPDLPVSTSDHSYRMGLLLELIASKSRDVRDLFYEHDAKPSDDSDEKLAA